MTNTQTQECTLLDELLDSGEFATLDPEEQIAVYFKSIPQEEIEPPLDYHQKTIVDYNRDLHEESVDDLLQRAAPFLGNSYDLPGLEDLGCCIQVCLVKDELVAFIAHEKFPDFRYINLLVVDEKWEGNNVMAAMLDYLEEIGDPLVIKVRDSNNNALAAFESCGFKGSNCAHGYYEMFRNI